MTTIKTLADEIADFLAGAVFTEGSIRSATNVEDARDTDGPILARLLKRVDQYETDYWRGKAPWAK